jgi:hypothetical protein
VALRRPAVAGHAHAWNLDWPYFVPHARDYGGFKVEGGKWKGLW